MGTHVCAHERKRGKKWKDEKAEKERRRNMTLSSICSRVREQGRERVIGRRESEEEEEDEEMAAMDVA